MRDREKIILVLFISKYNEHTNNHIHLFDQFFAAGEEKETEGGGGGGEANSKNTPNKQTQ